METEIVSNLRDFENMREEWNTLATNFPTPLLRHEWFAACVDAFCSKSNLLATFVIRSGGTIRAIAPLIAVHYAGASRLETLGRYTGEPSGFLYSDEESLRALLKAMFMFRKSFVLTRFNITSMEIQIMRELLPKYFLCVKWNGGVSPWVPLNMAWRDFEANISPGRRSDLRRYRRRAERVGQVEFQVVHPDKDTLIPHLMEVFRVEASGWKGRNGSAILLNPSMERFYNHYARMATEFGMLRLFYLRVGGKIAAVRMAVEHGNRLWDLKIGYDETFSQCSPGILLTHETLRYACDQGLAAHEFLGWPAPWEKIWTNQAHEYLSPRVYPFSLNGSFCVLQDVGRFTLRKADRIIRKSYQKHNLRTSHQTQLHSFHETGGIAVADPACMG
jgi:CelD/BcsL family acetyltransferase involved in cellulose biosynthesis